MNSNFTQIGQKLSEALDSSFDTSDVSYINRITPTRSGLEMNQKRFDEQCKDIKPEKAMRCDQIGSKEFKIAGGSVKPGIQNIIMKSISNKTYPNNWKLTIMKSLHKKVGKSSIENYRPISYLSIPTKLLEGQVCYLIL